MNESASRLRAVVTIAMLAILPVLSGCVAAIPVVAASAIAGKKVVGGKRHRDSRPEVALPAEPATAQAMRQQSATPALVASMPEPTSPPGTIVRTQEFADGSKVEVSMPARASTSAASELPPATGPAVAPPPASTASAPSASATADGTRVTLISGGMPAPGGRSTSLPIPPSATAPPRVSVEGAYAAFENTASREGGLPIAGAERRSAMLTDEGSLEPVTRECSIHPPAVLIDLDPAGATLDPARATRADPAFSRAIADLRDQNIAIAWISGVTADKADAVRRALVTSGLDSRGHDELVLLRFPEERKQTRREDLAKDYCVVAIAGDERADFDELFAYLRQPTAAQSLDPLVGTRWFLIPQPLTTN